MCIRGVRKGGRLMCRSGEGGCKKGTIRVLGEKEGNCVGVKRMITVGWPG